MLGGSGDDRARRATSWQSRRRPAFVVIDPVMISKTGFALLAENAALTLRERLAAAGQLSITPNVHEAAGADRSLDQDVLMTLSRPGRC